ncbi:MAG: hypothetical protein KGD66_05230 [Candidatus Lokiarchaeota archaeon]|nr:hypothetical protein [Candidatus Lokiarchaeota archaeon]
MKDIDKDIEFSKYYRLITPNEIDIDREDIFYRDKYNDIINYLKIMLTNHEESIVQSYDKFIQPKGAILINIMSGTDIDDYLKLISKKYYLNFYELNQKEIIKAPEEFIINITSILESLPRIKDIEEMNKNSEISQQGGSKTEKNRIKGIILINQENFPNIKLKERNFLEHFIISFKNKKEIIKNGLILIWINNNIKEIEINSRLIFEAFDLFIKIPLLDKIERESIFRSFSEKNPKIVFDIKTLVDLTKKWESRDINHLIKIAIFKHYLNSELNDVSNEITHILKDLIESGEFIPSISSEIQLNPGNDSKNQNYDTKNPEILHKSIISDIQNQSISDFMLNQLYENAASQKYTELLIILDKLNKKEILEENDLIILSKYPFILNDNPQKAQINLEKAKKKIEQIKQAFGK